MVSTSEIYPSLSLLFLYIFDGRKSGLPNMEGRKPSRTVSMRECRTLDSDSNVKATANHHVANDRFYHF